MSRAGSALLAAGLGLLVALPALASGQLQVRPTLAELRPGTTASRLTLANPGDRPLAVQVRVYAWQQVDGEDRLSETDRVLVTPPIATLPAGGEQVLRVVRTGPAPQGTDATYRVVVDQIPEAAQNNAVSLRMRLVLPLFDRAAGALPAQLTCQIQGTAGAKLRCDNTGGRAAQLGASILSDTTGHNLPLTEGLFGYVLPGRYRLWALPAKAASLGPDLRLDTHLDGTALSLPVPRHP